MLATMMPSEAKSPQPGRSCRTCTRLSIAFLLNTFPNEASATPLITSLKFFFRGPGIIPPTESRFPKNSFSTLQLFSFPEAFVFPALSQSSGLQDQAYRIIFFRQFLPVFKIFFKGLNR